MKEFELKGLDIKATIKTLDNGLKIILLPYTNKKNYYITYGTIFGADTLEFKVNGKYIKAPCGVAHFLEHKLFETEDGEKPFEFFSKSGSGVNASTSYECTQYLCFGTKNFSENLKYLINLVNKPYFTDENVEKEKDIIKQELLMYDDVPEAVLENKLRENLYHVLPRRYDIGGKCEDVDSITKEDLYNCYNTFYKPNNMFIIVSGGFDIKEALNIIEEELVDKESEDFKVKELKEPKSVVKKRDELSNSNVKIPKIAMGFKISLDDIPCEDDLDTDLYLQMIATTLFGPTSLFKEDMRNRHLMTGFYYSWETVGNYKSLLVMAESEEPDLLIEEIKKTVDEMKLDEDSFERTKKVWVSGDVKLADYVEAIASNVMDDYIRYGEVFEDKISRYRSLKYDKLIDISKVITSKNMTSIIMLPGEISKKEFK